MPEILSPCWYFLMKTTACSPDQMMQFNLKDSLKYLISAGIAVVLFWYLYRDQNAEELLGLFARADPFWLAISVGIGLLSHFTRAWRWVLALKPLGYRASRFRAFLAVMVGYVVNLALPRAGEFVRCGLLHKTDNVPVNHSFGALIAERAIDLVMLLTLIAVTFALEFGRIGDFVFGEVMASSSLLFGKVMLLGLVAATGFLILFWLYKLRGRFRKHFLYRKAKEFFLGIKDGLLSIKDLSRAEQWLFVGLSAGIWVMYYLMSWVLFLSMPETARLGFMAALIVLAMASVGMAIPTPGGTGSYHFFVSYSLSLYGLGQAVSRNFAFMMHGLQTLALLFFGVICLVIVTAWLGNKKHKSRQVTVPND